MSTIRDISTGAALASCPVESYLTSQYNLTQGTPFHNAFTPPIKNARGASHQNGMGYSQLIQEWERMAILRRAAQPPLLV